MRCFYPIVPLYLGTERHQIHTRARRTEEACYGSDASPIGATVVS